MITRCPTDASSSAVLGRSSGGQVALSAAYVPDTVIAPSCPERPPAVRAVLAYYPPVALDQGYALPQQNLLRTGRNRLWFSPGALEEFAKRPAAAAEEKAEPV